MASTRAPSKPRSANSARPATRIAALVFPELRDRLAGGAFCGAAKEATELGSDTLGYRRNGHQDGDNDDQADNSADRTGKERRRIAIGEQEPAPQVEIEQVPQDDAQHQWRHREL